jgi:hypothetical protein
MQGSLARQEMQKTVLKRQGSLARTRPAEKCLKETGPGRLVSFNCALLAITNKCNHLAWISDILSCVILETVKLLAGKD